MTDYTASSRRQKSVSAGVVRTSKLRRLLTPSKLDTGKGVVTCCKIRRIGELREATFPPRALATIVESELFTCCVCRFAGLHLLYSSPKNLRQLAAPGAGPWSTGVEGVGCRPGRPRLETRWFRDSGHIRALTQHDKSRRLPVEARAPFSSG